MNFYLCEDFHRYYMFSSLTIQCQASKPQSQPHPSSKLDLKTKSEPCDSSSGPGSCLALVARIQGVSR